MWRLVDRIAYEEMSESVRNPYCWPIGPCTTVARPTSPGMRSCLGCTRFSGFTCTSRDGLAWPCTSCPDQRGMAAQTSLGMRRAVIPLCAVALSPTLLYFNAMQAQFGLELQTASHQHRTLGFFPLRAPGQGPGLAGRLLVVGHGRFVGLPAFGLCCQPWESPTSSESANSAPTDIGRSMPSVYSSRSRLRAPFAGFAAFLRDPSILSRAFRGGKLKASHEPHLHPRAPESDLSEFFLKGRA